MIALIQLRCPRCREGRLFRTRFEMYKKCPHCELVWEREPGYFMGAMYVSYALAIPFLCAAMFVWHLLFPNLDPVWTATLAVFVFIPFVPLVFRYSRVIWMYFDHWAWPENSE